MMGKRGKSRYVVWQLGIGIMAISVFLGSLVATSTGHLDSPSFKNVNDQAQSAIVTVSAIFRDHFFSERMDDGVCDIRFIEIQSYLRVIIERSGNLVNPYQFPPTVKGLQRFMKAVGVRYFSADEVTEPWHGTVARRLGFAKFLPPRCRWLGGAALFLIADQIRELTKEPIRIRNWWRPQQYNSFIATAKSSDHIQARAIDIDFFGAKGEKRKATALRWLCKRYWKKGYSIQIGNYNSVALHIGLESPKKNGRRRNWGMHPCRPFKIRRPVVKPPLPIQNPLRPQDPVENLETELAPKVIPVPAPRPKHLR